MLFSSDMNIDFIQGVCEKLAGVTTDIKWGYDLVFSVGEKMFCVCSTEPPLKVSLKVSDEEFDEVCVREGFKPAPYLARAKWVLIDKPGKLNRQEWESFLRGSYELVKAKLPKKMQEKVQGTRGEAQAKAQGSKSKERAKVQGSENQGAKAKIKSKAQEEKHRSNRDTKKAKAKKGRT